MPRRIIAGTLKEICFFNVANNMEYWCNDYTQNFIGQGKFLHLLGPFDVLTEELVQHLINLLSQRKQMKLPYLHMLTQDFLRTLDLSTCGNVANKEEVIDIIALRCKRMKNLNLSKLNQIPGRAFVKLIDNLPHLTTLHLMQTKCDDKVLSRIAAIENLQDLNVSGCPVSDKGIRELCFRRSYSSTAGKKLVKLDVTNTAVSMMGAQEVLKSFPEMIFFNFSDICEALYLVYNGKNIRKTMKEQLQLRYLAIEQMNPCVGPVTQSVQVACLHCPFITKVQFLRGVDDQSLLALSILKNLKILILANCEEELITFDTGLLPLLQSCGASLDELIINEINGIDVDLIGVCCPILKKFVCEISGQDVANFPVRPHPELSQNTKKYFFSQLEILELRLYSPENNLSEVTLLQLLLNAKRLMLIQLACIPVLNDRVLEDVLKKNPLHELRWFNLYSCPNVTAEGIWNIISTDNELRSLSLLHCFEIGVADYLDFENYFKENNYSVSVEWK